MARAGTCTGCGGSKATHTGGEGCWCRKCLALLEEARCHEFVPAVPRARPKRVARPTTTRSTSQQAQAAASLRKGTFKRQMFNLVVLRGTLGYTDDELEEVTGKSHQSVSASRNGLMQDALLVDSGVRRKTRYGNDAIVWTAASNP